jgi:arylsulfatase A-like enzyme
VSQPNVFVLSADSLRLDRAVDPDVMPFVASETDAGLSFEHTVSNGGFTPASFPTMMASRYPSSIDGVGIPEEGGVTTLAEELREAGYDCGVWSDNKFVGPDYNYDRGYESRGGYESNLRDRVRQNVDEDGALFRALEFGYMKVWKTLKNAVTDSHYYDPARTLNARAREWLSDRDPENDSVHVWLHYMDSHHPYEPPRDWMPDDLEVVSGRTEANNLTRKAVHDDGEGLTDAELRDVHRLYDAECRYLDTEIQRFVDEFLRPEGWLTGDDLLVLTSDHGEILHDYEQWDEIGHGNFFCQECTRVPLAFVSDRVDAASVDRQVSLIDLVPTVLDIADLDPRTEQLLMGESLLEVARGEAERDPIFHDGTLGFHGAQAPGKKYFNHESLGEGRFLNTTFDPDSAPTYSEQIVEADADHEALASFVERRLAECENLAEEAQAIDPDSLQVEQHMRDLGYLE